MLTIFAEITNRSLRASLTNAKSMSWFVNLAFATTLLRAPSNSLMFDLILCAIYIAQSFGMLMPIDEALFKRTAALVSSSGGSITTGRPQPSLDLSLSSKPSISLGYLSQVRIIWLFRSNKALKVWKNSSWDCSLPAKNWISSISKASAFL